ncbi:MAG: hypothetical protein MJ252_14090 [archaeon]|nr:hypothetical protein [archaeon]
MEDKIKQINIRLDALANAKAGEGDSSALLILIQNLEKKTDQKFNDLDEVIKYIKEQLQKQKDDLDKLSQAHSNTVKQVENNTNEIEILKSRLLDISKNCKEGDVNLQREIDELKKYVDSKLLELMAQLELLMANPGKGGKISDGDLKIISDLIKRVTELEKEFREFMRKTNLDHIIEEIEQIKKQLKTKADIADINEIKETLEKFQADIEEILRKIKILSQGHDLNREDIDKLFKQMQDLANVMEEIKKLYNILNSKPGTPIQTEIVADLSSYVTINKFNEYINENDERFKRINDEIDKLKELIDQILKALNDKASYDDLEKLKKMLQQQIQNSIQELAEACERKFADKNETARALKYLEEQIRKLWEYVKKLGTAEHEGNNWLIAKKPMFGFTCACCESYLGELKDKDQYIPWNKYPLRDPNEKLYRIGSGYSRMLQMINLDPNDANQQEMYENVQQQNIPFQGMNRNNSQSRLDNKKDPGYHTMTGFRKKGGIENNENEKVNGNGGLPNISKKNASTKCEENAKDNQPKREILSATM